MGVTVQVRDLDEDVQEQLKAASEREGMSLSAFLRRELTRLAARLEAQELAYPGQKRNRLGLTPDIFTGFSTDEIVQMIREDRDR
jgi:hypothetical protein